MAGITLTYTFAPNTIIRSSQMNTNLATDIVTIYNAHDTATTAVHGISSTIAGIDETQTLTNKTLTAPVLSGTVTGTYTLGGTPTITSPTLNTPTITNPTMTGGGSLAGTYTGTYTLAGTPTLTAPTINGASISVSTITGSLTFTAASAIFPTGDGTTYDGNDEAASSYKIKQVGTDLAFYAGSTSTARLLVNGAAATVSIVSGVDFITPAAQKIRVDGSAAGDTFITESSANVLDLHAGNAANYRIRMDGSTAQVQIGAGMDLSVAATQKIRLDGSASGDTYISEPSANTFRVTTGGTDCDFVAGGIIPAAAPATPVADTFYREAVPRSWGIIASSGTAADSFNVASSAKNSTGNYSVVFTTNMASANYCVIVMPNKNAAVGTNAYITTTESMANTGFTIQILTDDDAAVDSAFSFVVFGAQ